MCNKSQCWEWTWVVSPKWDTSPPSTKAQWTPRKRGRKERRSQIIGRNAVRCQLLELTWLCTHELTPAMAMWTDHLQSCHRQGRCCTGTNPSNYWQLVAAGEKTIFFSFLACFWMRVLGFSSPSGGLPPAYSRGWPHMLSHVDGLTCFLTWMIPHAYSRGWLHMCMDINGKC